MISIQSFEQSLWASLFLTFFKKGLIFAWHSFYQFLRTGFCLTTDIPPLFKTTSNLSPKGPPWTVWDARTEGGKNLSWPLDIKIFSSEIFVTSCHVMWNICHARVLNILNNRQEFVSTAYYNGQKMALKQINMESINLNRSWYFSYSFFSLGIFNACSPIYQFSQGVTSWIEADEGFAPRPPHQVVRSLSWGRWVIQHLGMHIFVSKDWFSFLVCLEEGLSMNILECESWEIWLILFPRLSWCRCVI